MANTLSGATNSLRDNDYSAFDTIDPLSDPQYAGLQQYRDQVSIEDPVVGTLDELPPAAQPVPRTERVNQTPGNDPIVGQLDQPRAERAIPAGAMGVPSEAWSKAMEEEGDKPNPTPNKEYQSIYGASSSQYWPGRSLVLWKLIHALRMTLS